jgi:hypothetical protein
MHASHPRDGSALIEVLIALVLLAVSGTALITLLGQTRHSIESLEASEREARAAGFALSSMVVLSRAELVARLGRRVVGGWSVTVEAIDQALFDVGVAASDTSAVVLRTTLYRPDTTSAATP